jgi:hypothetical protein
MKCNRPPPGDFKFEAIADADKVIDDELISRSNVIDRQTTARRHHF